MNLEKMLKTPQAQELLEYLDSMPAYAQGFVTDCIATTETLSQAADKFDEGILEYLKEYRPENVNEWLAELNDLAQEQALGTDLSTHQKNLIGA